MLRWYVTKSRQRLLQWRSELNGEWYLVTTAYEEGCKHNSYGIDIFTGRKLCNDCKVCLSPPREWWIDPADNGLWLEKQNDKPGWIRVREVVCNHKDLDNQVCPNCGEIAPPRDII